MWPLLMSSFRSGYSKIMSGGFPLKRLAISVITGSAQPIVLMNH